MKWVIEWKGLYWNGETFVKDKEKAKKYRTDRDAWREVDYQDPSGQFGEEISIETLD